MKKFLVVGANFINKGAQSMLFTCVSELKERFPDCEIYFKTAIIPKDKDKYNFNFLYCKDISYKLLDFDKKYLCETVLRILKSSVKYVLGRGSMPLEIFDLKRVIPQIDYIIDISGYCLTSKWGMEAHKEYFSNFMLAQKYNIPIILFPQSYGPFEYGDNQIEMEKEIKKWMGKASLVFAREREGAKSLGKFGVQNIIQCADLVLLSERLAPCNVYNDAQTVIIPNIKNNAVGIVPNLRCFVHGNKEIILKIYCEIINTLLAKEKIVYLFRHSLEDLEVCYWIKDFYLENENVVVLDDDLDCFQTAEISKKFEFIISSRYHSIVHAYRNAVPCILLGWAIKYIELSQLMTQEKFVFDITVEEVDVQKLLENIVYLCNHSKKESLVLEKRLIKVRKSNNCFDLLEQFVDSREI